MIARGIKMHSVFNNSLVDMIDSCIAKADCNGEKSLPKIRKYTAYLTSVLLVQARSQEKPEKLL